jgi:hypothetical protein
MKKRFVTGQWTETDAIIFLETDTKANGGQTPNSILCFPDGLC